MRAAQVEDRGAWLAASIIEGSRALTGGKGKAAKDDTAGTEGAVEIEGAEDSGASSLVAATASAAALKVAATAVGKAAVTTAAVVLTGPAVKAAGYRRPATPICTALRALVSPRCTADPAHRVWHRIVAGLSQLAYERYVQMEELKKIEKLSEAVRDLRAISARSPHLYSLP